MIRPAVGQVGKLTPIDEADKNPSFYVFRARLFEAVQRRDLAFVLGILSPNIKNSFGGDDGIEGFKKIWKPEQPESNFWNTFVRVMGLGGSFDREGRFLAPYTYGKFPNSIDSFEHGAIIGENVRVRKEPKLDSAVVDTLSFDIVKVLDWNPNLPAGMKEKWVIVSLRDGGNGYVAGTYIRSPIDYRAGFEKKDGKWSLIFFVSGD
jgi:hypothetical protein